MIENKEGFLKAIWKLSATNLHQGVDQESFPLIKINKDKKQNENNTKRT